MRLFDPLAAAALALCLFPVVLGAQDAGEAAPDQLAREKLELEIEKLRRDTGAAYWLNIGLTALVPLLVAQPLAALLTAVVLAGDPRWEDPDMLLLLTGLVPLGALVASVGVSLHLAVVLLGVAAIGVGVGAGALVQAVALRALPGGDRSAVATAWTATLLVEAAGAALFGLVATMLDPAGAYLAAAAITGAGIAWAAQTRDAAVGAAPTPAD